MGFEPAIQRSDTQPSTGETVGPTLPSEGGGSAPPGSRADIPGEVPGDFLGPFKLLEIIGEGGFGVVWLAERREPFAQRVAIKVIKPGMDSRDVIARFEQERAALAIMDHPNVARVFDAGATPAGRPYFVMEYVQGEPLTRYCDRRTLSIPQRLELFVKVCEAVQHAHTKGIIHRDLKPGNILVVQAQGAQEPQPKIIDFGIAKALSRTLVARAAFTEAGQIIGTPEYMSPEQARVGSQDVDTRTDVYALGVILYELLTGALPFDPATLRSAAYEEIQRIIREVEPPRPSTRVSAMGDTALAAAQARQTQRDTLARQLRNELEWLPLKAMRKDRDRRYRSPAELADDIRNYLAGRPLLAGPESAAYRARKFVHRHRMLVSAATFVVLALGVGGVTSAIGFVRASANLRLATDNLQLANDRLALLEEEESRLRAAFDFTRDLLYGSDPYSGNAKDLTVRELLERGAGALEERGGFKSQPRAEAAVRQVLGMSFRSVQAWEKAEQQIQAALDLETRARGTETPEAAGLLARLGQVQLDQGKFDLAQQNLDQALAIQRRVFRKPNWEMASTLASLAQLAEQQGDPNLAIQRWQEALAVNRAQPESQAALADVLAALSGALGRAGRAAEARAALTESIALRKSLPGGENQHATWDSLTQLALTQESQNDLAGAEQSRRDALAIAARLVDEENDLTARSLTGLAYTLWLRGGDRLAEAEALQRRAIAVNQKIFGQDSPQVAQGLNVLACILRDNARFDEAIATFQQELDLRARIQSPDHPDLAITMTVMADALTRAGRGTEAVTLAQRALQIRVPLLGENHWAVWNTRSVLGGAFAAAGDFAQAEPLLLNAFKALEPGTPIGSRPAADTARRLAGLYEKVGNSAEAERWRTRLAEFSPSR